MATIRVLFLCTANSARSIIAAGLLRQLGGDDFAAFSAGTRPAGINPYTVRVLEPLAIDLSKERSKHVSEFADQSFDYVITVCDSAAEECPVFPGAGHRLHWSVPDPAAVDGNDAEKLAAFQRAVDDMRSRLAAFIPEARRTAGLGV